MLHHKANVSAAPHCAGYLHNSSRNIHTVILPPDSISCSRPCQLRVLSSSAGLITKFRRILATQLNPYHS